MQDNQSHVEWAQQNIAGTYSTAEAAAQRLMMAAQHCNLVGGASVCPLKVGHQIVISVVPINAGKAYPTNRTAKALAKGQHVDPEHPDYTPPEWGPGKADLMALAAAAGVQWIECRRLDDKSDPYFCHYRVIGEYPSIDGSMRRIDNERDVDLRDGSPQIDGMGDFQVKGLRENMIRLAITKARLRAIREAFGVPHSMTAEELKKPWVFSRMIFTGHSDDPAVRLLFAQTVAMQQLAATNALYGQLAGAPAVPALPAIPSSGALPAPAGPPVAGALPPAHADFDESDLPDEPPPPPPPPKASPPPPQAQPPKAQQRRQEESAPSNRPRTNVKLPGNPQKSKWAGRDLADVPDTSLKWWADRLGKNLAEGTGKPEFRAKDEAVHKALLAEIADRARTGQQEF